MNSGKKIRQFHPKIKESVHAVIHLERVGVGGGREGAGCFDSVETGLLNACLKVGRCATGRGRRVLDDEKCIDCSAAAAAAAAFGRTETTGGPKRLCPDPPTQHSAKMQRKV